MDALPSADENELGTRLAVSAGDVANLLGISPRSVWKLHAAGRLPKPVRLGRSTRWDLSQLRDWVAAGAPSRDEWDAARNGGADR